MDWIAVRLNPADWKVEMRNGKHRIWNSYDHIYGSHENRIRSINEIASWIQTKIDAGYKPYFLTFMFDQLNGNRQAILAQMHRQIEQFNRKLITRVHRSPNSKGANDNLPILIGFADLPAIFKNTRRPLVDIVTNDGLHFHAILLMPEKSRIKGSFIDHYEKNKHIYVGDGPLNRIHILKIERKPGRIVQYTFKAFKWNRISWDEGFTLFPKSASETNGGVKFNLGWLSDLQKGAAKVDQKTQRKKSSAVNNRKTQTKKLHSDNESNPCQTSKSKKLSKAEWRVIGDAAYAEWVKTRNPEDSHV